MKNRGTFGVMNYKFPAPREVDRCLYKMQYITIDELVTFPAPREVDRELYRQLRVGFPRLWVQVSGPSRGR